MQEKLPLNTAHSWLHAYAKKDWSGLWSLTSPRVVYDEIATRRKTHGIRRFMTILQEWGAVFPDSEITVTGVQASGNTVVFDLNWTGAHDGPMETPGGTILPTGKRIDLAATMTVEVGEETVEAVTHSFDMEKMEKQMGLAPIERAAEDPPEDLSA